MSKMIFKGNLITGDFQDKTMTFEIEGEMTLQGGNYTILPSKIYEELVNGDKSKQKALPIQHVSSRFNLVADVMPARNEYVLIKTPHCKYPATVGFWNGIKWLAADDKCEIVNVSEWLALNDC